MKCPISNNFIECREDCAWFNKKFGQCDMTILALSIKNIGQLIMSATSNPNQYSETRAVNIRRGC